MPQSFATGVQSASGDRLPKWKGRVASCVPMIGLVIAGIAGSSVALGGPTGDGSAYALMVNDDAADTMVLSGGFTTQTDCKARDGYAVYVETQDGLILEDRRHR